MDLIIQYINNSRINILDRQYKQENGVPQGSSLSGMLFIIYLDEVMTQIEKEHPEISASAFAGDMVIRGKSTAQSWVTSFTYLRTMV